jgi:hypothetical protein
MNRAMWTSVTWNSAADFAGALRSRRRIQSQGRGGRAVVSKYLSATCDPLSIGCVIPAGLLVRRFLKTGCPAILRMTAVGHHYQQSIQNA